MFVTAIAIYVHAFVPFCMLLAVASWRWGGSTARQASIAFATAMIAAKLTQGWGHSMYSSVEWSVAVLDFLLVIWFFRLSFRYPKGWMLAVTALQLLSASAHLARIVDVSMSPLAYALLTGSGAYPILILLAVGTAVSAHHGVRMPAPVAND